MPFAINLERKELLFLSITMKAREKDIQINDKSTVSVFLVSLGPSKNAVFRKTRLMFLQKPEDEANNFYYLSVEKKSLH